MTTNVRLVTLEEDTESVRRLSLAALKVAGEGTGKHAPKARRAYQAYKLAMDSGQSEDDAVEGARRVLRAGLGG